MSAVDYRDEVILRTLKAHPGGLGINELARLLKDVMSRPTLRLWLGELEGAGIVKVERGRHGRKHRIYIADPEMADWLIDFSEALGAVMEEVSSIKTLILTHRDKDEIRRRRGEAIAVLRSTRQSLEALRRQLSEEARGSNL